jgi:hypothetical protein
LEKGSIKTDFAKELLKDRGKVEVSKNNSSRDWGVGVWGVQSSQRRAVEVFLGKFHSAYFYGDKKKTFDVLAYLNGIRYDIKVLKEAYSQDGVTNDEKVFIAKILMGLFAGGKGYGLKYIFLLKNGNNLYRDDEDLKEELSDLEAELDGLKLYLLSDGENIGEGR